MGNKNPRVNSFLTKAKKWHEEFELLRDIILGFDLAEDLKWGQPCYMHDGRNVVLIHGFKEYCGLLFFKGALMKDPKGILTQPGETQAGRQIRFTSVKDITRLKTALKAYVREAIEVERAGLKIERKKTSDYAVPEEFQRKLDSLPALKAAFEGLTPGRQRAYLYHFSSAKQSKTRESRVEKCMPQILEGKGLDDE